MTKLKDGNRSSNSKVKQHKERTETNTKQPRRRVHHKLSLGTLVKYSKITEDSFADLSVVHVEEHHPLPRWWLLSTSLMGASIVAILKWFGL
jgi:hypothetical protein